MEFVTYNDVIMDLHSLSRRVSSQLPPGSASVHLISSQCTYYHYLCDGTDDRVRFA